MVTRFIDRVPVDRISDEARQVDLGRALLTLLLGVFWLLGWLVGMASVGIGFAYAAAKVGFQEARGPAEKGPARGRPA